MDQERAVDIPPPQWMWEWLSDPADDWEPDCPGVSGGRFRLAARGVRCSECRVSWRVWAFNLGRRYCWQHDVVTWAWRHRSCCQIARARARIWLRNTDD